VVLPFNDNDGLGGDMPAGVALDEIDPTGALVGDWGPMSTAESTSLVGAQIWGARQWVVGAFFQQFGPQEWMCASSTTGFTVQVPAIDGGCVQMGSVSGDAAGDTFAWFSRVHCPGGGWTFPWEQTESAPFLVKFDPTGTYIWSYPGGGALTGDGTGGVYITGGSTVVRLSASGQLLWSKAVSGSVLPAGGGSAFVTGSFQGTVDLGCGPMSSGAGTSSFVAEVDPSGACVWSRAFATGGMGVVLYPSGDLLLSTTFSGTLDFGSGPLESAGTSDCALAQLSPSGAVLWTRTFGSPGATVSCAQGSVEGQGSVDATGSVALGVTVTGAAVDFGGGPVSGSALVKLDASGAFRWQVAPYPGQLLAGGPQPFASDPCGAVITAATCATCAPAGGQGVSITKLAP
jgi:hypothetical protein